MKKIATLISLLDFCGFTSHAANELDKIRYEHKGYESDLYHVSEFQIVKKWEETKFDLKLTDFEGFTYEGDVVNLELPGEFLFYWFPESSSVNRSAYASLTQIGSQVFAYCDDRIKNQTQQLNLPETIEAMDDYALAKLSALQKITFPPKMTHIPAHVCRGCSGLKEAILGENITSIGEFPFFNCGQLELICIDAQTPPSIAGPFIDPQNPAYHKIKVIVPYGTVGEYETAWASIIDHIELIESTDNVPSSVLKMGKDNSLSTTSIGNQLNIKCQRPTNLSIYSLTGALVESAENVTNISYNLPHGVYIIRTNDTSYKIVH